MSGGQARRRELDVRSPSGPVLAAWESGSPDGSPIVLLHGLTMTGDGAFAGTAGLERRGLRVLAFDARGHGRSQPAADLGGYGYDLLAADLAAVMDAFGVARAVLAGVSMGGHTALRLALDEPGRVAGLAVISPAFDPDDHPNDENLAEAAALAAGLRQDGADGFVAALRIPDGHAPDSATVRAGHAFTRRRLREHRDLDALGDALEANLRAKPFDAFAELAAVDVPVLVIGTRDELDSRHPLELARSYARALPGSRFECERQGQMPLGWGGRRLTRLLAELVERADWGDGELTATRARAYVRRT